MCCERFEILCTKVNSGQMAACRVGLDFGSTAKRSLQTGRMKGAVTVA